MRAEEGDESIEELAKDAANVEKELDKAVNEEPGGPPSKPPHRSSD